MSRPMDPREIEALRRELGDRYAIGREVGAGGMAVVFLARDLRHDRDVALKVLRSELGAMMGVERFQREIRLAAQLSHPHILPLLDSGAAAGHLWYAMPFVPGESLGARLARERQLPVEDALRITSEVAEALAYAHGRGILHRDIKPDNILLSEGHALVADFGIARAISGGPGEPRITGTGISVGTPAYMSPEQATGEDTLDGRSDLYALACVTYEMLAGEPPYTGPTAQVIIARRLSQPVPPLRTIREQVPEQVETALRRALAPLPADRFAGTAAFAAALTAAEPTPPSRGSRHPAGRIGIALAIALLLATAWFVWRRVCCAPTRAGTPASGSAQTAVRLAVLPLRLISPDTADRYLADGMTEELISTLSNLGGLQVIARTSVTPFAGSTKTAGEIGAALGVSALLEGDVQKAGPDVRVRIKLIDVATQASRWSQEFDHSLGDIFKLQSEFAEKVAGVLRIQLAASESNQLARPPTTNPAAYEQFLRARAQGTGGALATDSAIVQYGRAVRLDPGFAAAWAGLGASYAFRHFSLDDDPQWLDSARTAIDRALREDSSIAKAWMGRGNILWNAAAGWDFAGALRAHRRAISLQPSSADAHSALGSLLFHYGFLPEATKELETSLSLDPGDRCGNQTGCAGFNRPRLARVFWYRQRFDSALALFGQLPPESGWNDEAAVVLGDLGRPAEGLARIGPVLQSSEIGVRSDAEAVRALLEAMTGDTAKALEDIRRAMAHPNTRSHFHHAQFLIACAYARMGRTQDAVEWLRKTAENGMPNLPLFRNDPNLRPLQGNPEYERLMAELKTQFDGRRALVDAPPPAR